jgi:hypothetical protein
VRRPGNRSQASPVRPSLPDGNHGSLTQVKITINPGARHRRPRSTHPARC